MKEWLDKRERTETSIRYPKGGEKLLRLKQGNRWRATVSPLKGYRRAWQGKKLATRRATKGGALGTVTATRTLHHICAIKPIGKGTAYALD